MKNRSPKNMKHDAKRIPTWSPNRCQNASEIHTQTISKNIMKIIKIHVFLTGKIIQIVTKYIFEGLAGCVRER